MGRSIVFQCPLFSCRWAIRGVLVAFRTTIPHTINSYVSDNKGRYLVAHVTITGEELTIVNAYLHPQMVKDEFCKVLASITEAVAKMQNERVIWCGDFNVVLDEQLDSNKPAPRWCTMVLRALMDDWELTDTWRALHPTEKQFSCYSKSTGTLSRLDLILASPSFLTHLLDVDIGISYQSDHSPVVLQFTLNENERGGGFWRMPDYVISDPEFQARVAAEVKTISICNPEVTPNLLWDTVKASI